MLDMLKGKNIVIIGYGREGRSAAAALRRYVPDARLTIADSDPVLEAEGMEVQKGPAYLEGLERFDVVIKSPGVHPDERLEILGEKVTNCANLFLTEAKAAGVPVIGVTGSKGKSTTSSLIYELEKAAGRDAYLVGNIGRPPLDYLEHLSPGAVFVQELSSYQLMEVRLSPPIAVITSFFPDHLDYHGSEEAYWQAKRAICAYQGPEDIVFYSGQYQRCQELAEGGQGKKAAFLPSDAPLPISETLLLGEHNLSNIAAAYKVALYRRIDPDVCLDVFRHFHGLPHRLEHLGSRHGIVWVDDAISTTPQSTMAALEALEGRVGSIIVGGLDRGYDFRLLGERLAASSVVTLIFFPGSGEAIARAVTEASGGSPRLEMLPAADMETAVRIARQKTPPGSICLLSTASPSYNMFRNYEEKGESFKECIADL